MGNRGFFAELQHQARLAERERLKALQAAEKQHKKAIKDAERALKAKEKAAKKLAMANEAERKRVEKELKLAHIDAMQAEVEAKNSELAAMNEDLNTLLKATLDVDDFVDLESLRMSVVNPPFNYSHLMTPIPPPEKPTAKPKPYYSGPEQPTGLFAIFSKSKHEKEVARSKEEYEYSLKHWEKREQKSQKAYEEKAQEHAAKEAGRKAELALQLTAYQKECDDLVIRVKEHNIALDQLIVNLGYGVADAIEEYISIVLSNSAYPNHFQVNHEFSFDSETAELKLKALIPGPEKLQTTKAYKYNKSKDEITASTLSQKDQRDRYSSAVFQIAIRTLHEVFEADRRGLINTITLEVGAKTIAPATGREVYVPFVSTAAARSQFLEFDLTAIQPKATLKHLGAAISKNPFGLEPADTKGIRKA